MRRGGGCLCVVALSVSLCLCCEIDINIDHLWTINPSWLLIYQPLRSMMILTSTSTISITRRLWTEKERHAHNPYRYTLHNLNNRVDQLTLPRVLGLLDTFSSLRVIEQEQEQEDLREERVGREGVKEDTWTTD